MYADQIKSNQIVVA